MSTDKIQISEAVMERVNNELVRAILETPDYVKKLVEETLKEPGKYNSYDREDYNKPLFERILRAELREMVRSALVKLLREKYSAPIETAVAQAVDNQAQVEGTLANALYRLLEQDYKLSATVSLSFESERSRD